MEEYSVRNEEGNKPEKIDITYLLTDFYHGVRKFWWLVIGLALIFAVKSYFSVSTGYVPNYVASATVSVSSASGSYGSAQEMAQLFPYIMTSGVLEDVIAEDMGVESIPGSITAEADEGTNLLTVSVSSSDPQMAYNILQSVLNNYPEVAEFVLGQTTLTVLDETGIPTDTGRMETIRGSYKRGALKGAMLGCIFIVLYALTRRTVKSKKELKKGLNLTDCGSIPYIRAKKRKKDTFHNAVNLLNERIPQVYLESVRKLRVKVMKDMEENNLKTLLITSSIPGEGKTTLAVNLAISIAQQGKNVLLVDCDMRNPSVAGVMNEHTRHPGLGEVLRKKVSLKEAIVPVEVSGGQLDILYGGKADDKDSKLLSTKGMEAFIKTVSKKADIVILDTAPSELLADAPLLARYADAALYVIRNDYTKMRQIREGVQALAMSGIHIIGYVYNGDTSGRGHGYGYGYGYKRYGGYGGYGGYGRYGAYGHYKEGKKGTQDKYGRVIKE